MRARLAHFIQHNDPNYQWAQESDAETIRRNRYANVGPWSNNRVRLKVPEGESDYINASPITIRTAKGTVKKFIATQVRNTHGYRRRVKLTAGRVRRSYPPRISGV